MPNHVYNTPRQRDVALFDALLALASDLQLPPEQLMLNVVLDDHRAINISLSDHSKNADLASIRQIDSTLVERATLSLRPWNGHIRYRNTPTIGEVEVVPGQGTTMANAVRFLDSAHKHFPTFERSDAFDKLLGDELAEFYRKREASLLRLEDLSQRVIEKNDEYRRRLDSELQNSEQRLQEKYNKEFEALQAEHKQKLESVQEREKAVEVRNKELDDRSARHARRQIRQDMKTAIQNRSKSFSLTEKTVHKRIIIHCLFGALIAFLIAMVVLGLIEYNKQQGAEATYLLIKVSLASIATVATLVYYIRWNNHWFMRHAEEEFALMRFEQDFDRASWIAEMALEWKDEERRQFPPELLSAVTANLFGKSNTVPHPTHPYEDLAALLLGASAEMNLNIPGVGSFKLGKDGGKRLLKALQEQQANQPKES